MEDPREPNTPLIKKVYLKLEGLGFRVYLKLEGSYLRWFKVYTPYYLRGVLGFLGWVKRSSTYTSKPEAGSTELEERPGLGLRV